MIVCSSNLVVKIIVQQCWVKSIQYRYLLNIDLRFRSFYHCSIPGKSRFEFLSLGTTISGTNIDPVLKNQTGTEGVKTWIFTKILFKAGTYTWDRVATRYWCLFNTRAVVLLNRLPGTRIGINLEVLYRLNTNFFPIKESTQTHGTLQEFLSPMKDQWSLHWYRS